MRTFRGTVDKNRKGFAFVSLASREFEDLFVPPREADGLFHGDRVEITVNARDEVTDIRVIEHRFRELVGQYSTQLGDDEFRHRKKKTKAGFVIYERRHRREEVYVPNAPAGCKEGDWVRARLQFGEGGSVAAEIVDVYGEDLPARADIDMVSGEFNLIEEHSPEAVSEAESFTLEVPTEGIPGRTDLRNLDLITIDGETARDFDDAVYVERKKDGGYVLWVAIADVSHYVKPGSALDAEAYSRATSVYFPERAFHMLPRALSENLCSLRPNEPRLAMAARMEFNRDGERVSTEVHEALIESKRRATYNEIEEEHARHGNDPGWRFSPHFELYRLLHKSRINRGALDFDLPEAEVRVDDDGDPISIEVRGRLDAHRLIEEFMIAANEAVTEWMLQRKWPFIYRVHEEPDPQALEKFMDLAATMGANLKLAPGEFNHPKRLADAIRKLEGHPAERLLNYALLRSLRQAVYSSTHGIHYGLASEAYTHFTSPIRRYPDLIVHRLLREVLHIEQKKRKRLSDGERQELEAFLDEAAEHCSYRERLAADADREAVRLKQVRMMKKHLGEEFEAVVNGMADKGMFAQIRSPYCEGFIPKDSLNDDFYSFNEERMIFYGKRKKRTFRIGNRIRIRVLRADINERRVEFELLEGPLDADPDPAKTTG